MHVVRKRNLLLNFGVLAHINGKKCHSFLEGGSSPPPPPPPPNETLPGEVIWWKPFNLKPFMCVWMFITCRRRRRPIVQSFGPDVHRSADTS